MMMLVSHDLSLQKNEIVLSSEICCIAIMLLLLGVLGSLQQDRGYHKRIDILDSLVKI